MRITDVIKNKWARLFIALALFTAYSVTATLLLGSACPSTLIFGMPCPACGMTRAHINFITLDISGAFEMHPLFWLSIPIGLYIILHTVNPNLAKNKFWTAALWIMSAALVVCYIVRMILYFPADGEIFSFHKNSLLGLIIGLLCG